MSVVVYADSIVMHQHHHHRQHHQQKVIVKCDDKVNVNKCVCDLFIKQKCVCGFQKYPKLVGFFVIFILGQSQSKN